MLKLPSEQTLQKIADSAHIPAVGYAYAELKAPAGKNKPECTKTSFTVGVQDTQVPNSAVNSETQFPASSLSKVVFTYLVLQLVKAKHIGLDESLCTILPNKRFLVNGVYPDEDTKAKAEKLTVKDVLSHTTRLPNTGPNWTPETTSTLSFIPEEELVNGYSYSGEAIFYLQQVIEARMSKVLGRSVTLEDLAQMYVFGKDALGMTHSTFLPQPDESNVVKVHSELGKSAKINEHTPYLNVANAAGSLLTTADDFAKFIAAWLENMSDPICQQAFMPSGDAMKCGLGWHIYRNNGEVIAYQFGENTDTRAFVAINVNTKRGAAFFTNSEHGMSIANQIFNSVNFPIIGDLREIYEEKKYPQCDEPGWQQTLDGKIAEEQGWQEISDGKITEAQLKFADAKASFEEACKLLPDDESKQRRLKWFNAVHSSALEAKASESFVGKFTNPFEDLIAISIKDGRLIYKEADREIRLVQIAENEFLPEKDQSFKISFDQDKMTIE
jgi:CubicO group peptidase (beta-lactamase class C family)